MVYAIKCELIPLQAINLMFASVPFAIRSALTKWYFVLYYQCFNLYNKSDDIIIMHQWCM